MELTHIWLGHLARDGTHKYFVYAGTGAGDGKSIPVVGGQAGGRVNVVKSDAMPKRFLGALPRDALLGSLTFHVSEGAGRRAVRIGLAGRLRLREGRISGKALRDLHGRITQLCIEHLAEKHGVTHVAEGRQGIPVPKWIRRRTGVWMGTGYATEPKGYRKLLSPNTKRVLQYVERKKMSADEMLQFNPREMLKELQKTGLKESEATALITAAYRIKQTAELMRLRPERKPRPGTVEYYLRQIVSSSEQHGANA